MDSLVEVNEDGMEAYMKKQIEKDMALMDSSHPEYMALQDLH